VLSASSKTTSGYRNEKREKSLIGAVIKERRYFISTALVLTAPQTAVAFETLKTVLGDLPGKLNRTIENGFKSFRFCLMTRLEEEKRRSVHFST